MQQHNSFYSDYLPGTQTDLPVFAQMAVLHEVDLYKTFIPFCTESQLLGKIGPSPTELLAYFYLNVKLVR